MVKGMNIALQLYSVRDEMAADFFGTLKKVKEMGYEGVEFAGLHGYTPSQVRDMLDELGLIPISAHVPFGDVSTNPAKVVEDYKEIGCEYIAIPAMGRENFAGGEKYEQAKKAIISAGRECNENEMTLLYHNHDFEFEKYEGKYLLDWLFEDISEEYLSTQLDTCWVNVGGEDPAEYIRKYYDRTPVVHLKDFYMEGKATDKLYDIIGEAPSSDEEKDKKFEQRPLGMGVQNMPKILEAAQDCGAYWVVVEQDSPGMGKTPMECAKDSINYLLTV